jgi:hypothetical protein
MWANFSGFAKQNCANAARKGKFAGSKAVALYRRSFIGEMLLPFDPCLRHPKKLLRKTTTLRLCGLWTLQTFFHCTFEGILSTKSIKHFQKYNLQRMGVPKQSIESL